MPNHRHSNDARKIVNTLIIGNLVREAPVRDMTISESKNANKNGTIKTVKLVTVFTKPANQASPRADEKLLKRCPIGPKADEKLLKLQDNVSGLEKKESCPLVDFSSIGSIFLIKTTSHPNTGGGSSPAGILDNNKGGSKR